MDPVSHKHSLDGERVALFKKRRFAGTARNKKYLSIIVILVVLAVISSVFVYRNSTTRPDTTVNQPTELLQASTSSTQDLEGVVATYGPKYDATIKEVENSNPSTWNKDMLDKAYLCLVYADKISAFSQVNMMLGYIEYAGNNGLNIDNNSWGINQAMRDAIKQRADTQSKELENQSR